MSKENQQSQDRINRRTDAANKRTAAKLLNIYDIFVDRLTTLSTELSESDGEVSPELLKNFKELASVFANFKDISSVFDPLVKRYNIAHKGYDTNTRQAQEDTKKRVAKTKKRESRNAPLEEQIVEVGHYDPRMKKMWDNLPEPKNKANKETD